MAKIYTVEIENDDQTVTSYSIAIPYGTCSTARDSASKIINSAQLTSLGTGSLLSPEDGVQLKVRFVNGNSASNPTLTINNGSSEPIVATKPIIADTNNGVAYTWATNCILDLVYNANAGNGGAWVISSIGAFNAASVIRNSNDGNILSWDSGYIAAGSAQGVILVNDADDLASYLVAANKGVYYKYIGATTTKNNVTYIQDNIYTYEETQQ